MAGPFTWWANRKSQMGMKPSAKKPPHLPGKEWWTDPPTTLPQPEHIEYVVQFQQQLLAQPGSQEQNALSHAIGVWLREARRLLHEERRLPGRADLNTTDGLLIAANGAMQSLMRHVYGLGGTVNEEVSAVAFVLQGRAEKLRRERAIESSKRVSMPYWDPKASNGGTT